MATQQKILGFTATVPRGDWNASTSYNQLNLVRHKTASFYSKVNNNQGIEPFVTQGWEDAWQVCAFDGDKQLGVDATVLVNQTTGEASAMVTRSFDSDGNPVFNFVFNGIKGEKGDSGTSVIPQDGRYYDPSLTYPPDIPTTGLLPLPNIGTVAIGKAYVVEDNEYKGQVDLYFKGEGGSTWTVIDNWGGIPGQAATIEIGTVTTLPAGSQATVQNVGTQYAARLNFGIPQGEQGESGQQTLYSTTGQNTDGAMTQKTTTDELLRDRGLLGAFDTISADGTTITRQTGYISANDIVRNNWEHDSSRAYFYCDLGIVFSKVQRTEIPTIKAVGLTTIAYESTSEQMPNICSLAPAELPTVYTYLIGPPSTITTESEFKAWVITNNIELQYKLATSYTEPAYNYLQQFYTKRNGEALNEIAEKSDNLIDIPAAFSKSAGNVSIASFDLTVGTYTITITDAGGMDVTSWAVCSTKDDNSTRLFEYLLWDTGEYKTFVVSTAGTYYLTAWSAQNKSPTHVKVMLNRGGAPRLHQPYTGGVAYKKDISSIQVFANGVDPVTTVGGTWQSIGNVTVGGQTLTYWKRLS